MLSQSKAARALVLASKLAVLHVLVRSCDTWYAVTHTPKERTETCAASETGGAIMINTMPNFTPTASMPSARLVSNSVAAHPGSPSKRARGL